MLSCLIAQVVAIEAAPAVRAATLLRPKASLARAAPLPEGSDEGHWSSQAEVHTL